MNYPTWAQMIEQAKWLAPKERERHALVSMRNNHQCQSCFCCACWYVIAGKGDE